MTYTNLTQETQDKLKAIAVEAFDKLSSEDFAGTIKDFSEGLSFAEAKFLKSALKDILQQEEEKAENLKTEFNTASKLLNYDPNPTCAASSAVTIAEARLNKTQKRINTFKAKFS